VSETKRNFSKPGLDAKGVFLGFISGGLLALSFPDFNKWYLAWVGLVPLLYALKRCNNLKGAFAIAFIAGFIFNIGIFYWAHEISGYDLNVIGFLFIFLFALYLALFGLILVLASKHLPLSFVITAPFVWVTMEYIRSNFFFLAFPWGLLGTSQYQNLPFIQIASITSIYGVSFILALINATVCEFIFVNFNASKRSMPLQKKLNKNLVLILPMVLILGTVYAFGYWRIAKPCLGKETMVASLQTFISAEEEQTKFAQQIVREHHIKLSEAAVRSHPDLIIWPESSVTTYLRKSLGILMDIHKLEKDIRTYLLIGGSERPKFKNSKTKQGEIYNSAFFISPKRGIIGRYDKIRLFIFGEYLPLRGTFLWPSWLVSNTGSDRTPGKNHKVFSLPQGKFGVVICWENIFPDLFRKFVKKGAQFMVNISNENMISGAGSYQLIAMGVFRAVENQIFLVRSTNAGISCFIDPKGRIIGRVKGGGVGNPVEGFSTQKITLSDQMTFYTKYGDLFAYLNIIATVFFLAVVLFKPWMKKG
jgi:apolipoprotein N-acyltransferase